MVLDQAIEMVPKAKPTVPTPRVGVDWSIAGPLLGAHLVAISAPFLVTWPALAMFGILYLVSGIGVTVGAHRLFTHQSFRATPFLRRLLALLFTISAQGSLARWVRDHHIHHRFADGDGDPHTPHANHGFWHAQLTWLWEKPPTKAENKRLYERFGGEVGRQTVVRFFSKPITMLIIHFLVICMVYIVGAWIEAGVSIDALATGWFTGTSCVVWGVFLRIIAMLHATSLVNSAGHLWGYRRYETAEASRNNWWVAIVSLGEGWHNNHHGRPAAANQGFHRWWEFDISFCCLLIAAILRLATDLRVYRASTGKTEIWFRRPNSASTKS